MRINKYIADSGYCSRREADQFIAQGRVTLNGRDCTDFASEVMTGDKVEVDGEPIRVAERLIYIALNKPSGITSTTDRSDPTNIIDFVGHKVRIFPIGRLDKASEGLIFLTNDGDIVNKVLRAGNAHQKEYVVSVERPFSDDFVDRMSRGVKLDTGERTLPCLVRRESPDTFRITLTQGLNRQIRRMCEAQGHSVKKLVRVRIMNITLRGIDRGKWRYLSASEVKALNETTENSSKTPIFVPKAKAAPKKAPQKTTQNKTTTINKKYGNNSRSKKRNVY